MKKIKLENTNEVLYYDKLDNGLEVYMLPNNNVNKFYLTLNTRFGSINTKFKYDNKEYDMPKGIAHYLEHLSFNMENGSVFDHYSKIGSSINAFTTYDITSYNVTSNNRFKENLEYLLEYVYTPYFTKELFQSEKGVIEEEVKMYKDDPGMTIVNGTLNNVFVNDERKYLVGGTVKDVKSIKLEDVITCYNAYYNPKNMFLIITGNFNPNEALAITSEQMNKLNINNDFNVKDIYPKEPEKVNKKEEIIKMNVDKPKVSIGIKIPKNNFKNLKLDNYLLKIYISSILDINFGNTSLLLEELQKGSIVDDLDYTVIESNDYFIVLILSSTYYPEYFKDKIIEKFNSLNIEDSDLKRVAKVNISNYILLFDSVVAVNNYIMDEVMDNNEVNTGFMNIMRNLNIDTCKKILTKLNNYDYTICKIMPKE
ncbi:MAG: insulinase family protein [Bacilli bacterium]|nr:insulinase family protein [Bacilli bacterium]MCI6932377.1 insulinase family protein [Mycoplasmatota bacterium]